MMNVMTVVATVNNEAEVRTYGISPARLLKIMCSPGLGLYTWQITSDADPRISNEMQVLINLCVTSGTCVVEHIDGSSVCLLDEIQRGMVE